MRHRVQACERGSCPLRTNAAVLVIVPPLNVTAPSPIKTRPPSCAQPRRTRCRLRPKPPPLRTAHAHRPRHASPPARAHICFGAGYRHAVEQHGALVHADHATHATLRTSTSATRRTLGDGIARRPHRAQHATRNVRPRTMRDATSASAPPVQRALRNVHRAIGRRNGAAGSGQQAPCGGHQRRYHSTARLPHRMDRVRANQHTQHNHTPIPRNALGKRHTAWHHMHPHRWPI